MVGRLVGTPLMDAWTLFDPLPFLFHHPSFGWFVGWLASLMLMDCVIQWLMGIQLFPLCCLLDGWMDGWMLCKYRREGVWGVAGNNWYSATRPQ